MVILRSGSTTEVSLENTGQEANTGTLTSEIVHQRGAAMADTQGTVDPASNNDEIAPTEQPAWFLKVSKQLEKIDSVDKRLASIEEKLKGFETELNETKNTADYANKTAEDAMKFTQAIDKRTLTLETENKALKRELRELKTRFTQQENQSRRNNLLFYGIPENDEKESWEDCETAVCNILYGTLGIPKERVFKFERVHRLGAKIDNKPRVIIAKFCYFKDREIAWSKRKKLSDTIYRLAEDYPIEILQQRQQLYPIFAAAKNCKTVKRADLKLNKLHIDGKVYTCDNLHNLPVHLRPENIATKNCKDVVLFCSKHSLLSNFNSDNPLQINMATYSSTEQYYQLSKAQFFNDDKTAAKIRSETDPHKLHALGKQIQNVDETKWSQQARRVLYDANMAKFSQVHTARQALLATGHKLLGEATKDPKYGIGLNINDPAAEDPSKWTGDNLFGRVLTEIRSEISPRTSSDYSEF